MLQAVLSFPGLSPGSSHIFLHSKFEVITRVNVKAVVLFMVRPCSICYLSSRWRGAALSYMTINLHRSLSTSGIISIYCQQQVLHHTRK